MGQASSRHFFFLYHVLSRRIAFESLRYQGPVGHFFFAAVTDALPTRYN